MGGIGSEAGMIAANKRLMGDVAVPDIVGLQYNSREETIKTRSITLTLTMMRLLFPGRSHQEIRPVHHISFKSARLTTLLQLQAIQHFLVRGM